MTKKGKYHQGQFMLSEEQKSHYIGNPNTIYYRSSWEKRLMIFLSNNRKIEEWNSEGVVIEYINPFDKRPHKYVMDFYFKTKDGKKYLVEVKPYKQAIEPRETLTPTGRRSKKRFETYRNEMNLYFVNKAKWKAAKAFCDKNDVTFLICTDDPEKSEKYSLIFKLFTLQELGIDV